MIETILNNTWLVIGIAGTLMVVQGFKAVVKHYLPLDDFSRKLITFMFAVVTGYLITWYFMRGQDDREKWAAAVAILNPGIYMFLLAYATRKRMLWLVAILKARQFVVRGSEEKVLDEHDKTVLSRRHDD